MAETEGAGHLGSSSFPLENWSEGEEYIILHRVMAVTLEMRERRQC